MGIEITVELLDILPAVRDFSLSLLSPSPRRSQKRWAAHHLDSTSAIVLQTGHEFPYQSDGVSLQVG